MRINEFHIDIIARLIFLTKMPLVEILLVQKAFVGSPLMQSLKKVLLSDTSRDWLGFFRLVFIEVRNGNAKLIISIPSMWLNFVHVIPVVVSKMTYSLPYVSSDGRQQRRTTDGDGVCPEWAELHALRIRKFKKN